MWISRPVVLKYFSFRDHHSSQSCRPVAAYGFFWLLVMCGFLFIIFLFHNCNPFFKVKQLNTRQYRYMDRGKINIMFSSPFRCLLIVKNTLFFNFVLHQCVSGTVASKVHHFYNGTSLDTPAHKIQAFCSLRSPFPQHATSQTMLLNKMPDRLWMIMMSVTSGCIIGLLNCWEPVLCFTVNNIWGWVSWV